MMIQRRCIALSLLSVLLLLSKNQQANAFAPPRGPVYQHKITSTTALSATDQNNNDLFGGFAKSVASLFQENQAVAKEEPVLEDVVIDPDFKLAGIFLGAGLLLDQVPYIQILLGLPVTLLGVLFLVQTFRIRFTFTDKAFELKMSNMEETGDNIVVGGANRWNYDNFVNYDFFPKGWIDQPQGPLLVYFKENQTPSDKWNEGPGAKANSEEALAAGAQPGQVHFFPALCNVQQLKNEFERRNCAKL